MEELKKGISRRNLLKGATLSAAGVAALGMFGCSPAGGSSSSSSKSDAAAGEKKHTWEVVPEAITDIAETVETEVLVIGAGYSGTCCALNAAQNGAKVTLVEKDGVPNGHGVGGTALSHRRRSMRSTSILTSPSKWSAGFPRVATAAVSPSLPSGSARASAA